MKYTFSYTLNPLIILNLFFSYNIYLFGLCPNLFIKTIIINLSVKIFKDSHIFIKKRNFLLYRQSIRLSYIDQPSDVCPIDNLYDLTTLCYWFDCYLSVYQNAETFALRAYKIGQVFVSYPLSMYLTLLFGSTLLCVF